MGTAALLIEKLLLNNSSRQVASRVGSADHCRLLYLCGGFHARSAFNTTVTHLCGEGVRASVRYNICRGGTTVFDTITLKEAYQQHSTHITTPATQRNPGRHYSTSSSRMPRKMGGDKTLAEQLFRSSLECLQPEKLLEKRLRIDGSKLQLLAAGERQPEKQFDIPDQGLYLVGFGKAVLGIAAHLVSLLDKRVLKGVLSVPAGTKETGPREQHQVELCENAGVKVMEGAAGNIPDENAEKAANELATLVEEASEGDLVLVLISGGGSALLPLPRHPLTLPEKAEVIRQLSRAGADIKELNTVRKSLSRVKGGGLAGLAQPANVLTLVLSDVVGDPLDFIASGPTVPNKDPPKAALQIVNHYGLKSSLPASALTLLKGQPPSLGPEVFQRVTNTIIGSNRLVLDQLAEDARSEGLEAVVLTAELVGEAKQVGSDMARLALMLVGMDKKEQEEEVFASLELGKNALDLRWEGKGLAVLCGGETTVKVRGKGRGGRNQEMVLAFHLAMRGQEEALERKGVQVQFLSAGTDGLDGPTDAAGAVWSSNAPPADLCTAKQCLVENNSYEFWRQAGGLVMTGHTGTNVMDLQIMLLLPKPSP